MTSSLILLLVILGTVGVSLFPVPNLASKGSLLSDLTIPDHVFAPMQSDIVSSCLSTYGPYGGTGGTTNWNDNSGTGTAVCGRDWPSRIDWRSGSGLDSITVTYGPNSTSTGPHGGTGGSPGSGCDFQAGEYITTIVMYKGSFVDTNTSLATTVVGGLWINTTNPRICLVGKLGGDVIFNSSTVFRAGEAVAYFFGISGSNVDQLGIGTSSLISQ